MTYLKHFILNWVAGMAAMFAVLLLVLGWGIIFGTIAPFLFMRENWFPLLILANVVVLGYANEMSFRRVRQETNNER